MRVRKKSQGPRPSIAEQLLSSMELPQNITGGLPEMALTGNREAMVERCQGILEYNEDVIRLDAGKMIVKFSGRNLTLKSMSDTVVVVQGYFHSIEFTV